VFGQMDIDHRIAQLSPTKRALLEQRLKQSAPVARPELRPAAERQRHAPLSFSQERLWFLEQLEPGGSLYNLPAIVPLGGPVDPALVEASVRQIVARHGALRTRFVVEDETPRQVIGDDVSAALDFSIIDLRAADRSPSVAPLSQTLNDEIWEPFDLAAGPLVRARLILQRGDESLLLVVVHHIIADGWALNIFTKEFHLLYEAARSGGAPNLPPPPPQYVDYAVAQRRSLEGDRLETLLSYWRAQLADAPALAGLPLDRPRPARQSFKGALLPFYVPRARLQRLNSLGRECGVVPFMALLSAFKVLLFRYTHQPKIVVGTPIANRNRSEYEAVIGLFANTLVLCSPVAPTMTFRELVARVRDVTLGAYEHQDLPFEKLVSELQPERSLGHNPLFQVMFTFQNLPAAKPKAEAPPRPHDRQAGPSGLDFKYSKFDLTLAMTEADDGLSAVFEYATDLFEATTIERMAAHLVNVIEHVSEHPDDPIASFSFLPAGEQKLIVQTWNDTGHPWPEVLALHGRFERQARETPDATAVTFRQTALTYAELDRRANQVARRLRSRGVGRGDVVGICLRRSFEMVTGLLGILKAGAAYMPIEPEFPEGRVAYMLRDAKVSQVLTTSDVAPVLAAHQVDAVALDRLAPDADDSPAPPVGLRPDDLAYVLFTSGSTGEPKGVMVSHGAIDNRLQWMQNEYALRASDRVMQKTPFTFDVSVWEFFWPLSVGACLVIAEPERHKESVYLVELIKKEQITCLHFVPSMLQMFLQEDLTGCDSLARIVCSGEALTAEQCRRLQALPGVRAHNLYGPTEAAVDVTHWNCEQWRGQYLSVPIGRPIANTQIYILNEFLQPAPIGVAGELYIGGHNLAHGYLNKPGLTARQFVANPFAQGDGARLYKTGDLARFRGDGSIEYVGRIDSQVKLRGLRIELGEIEAVLRQHPEVADAAVVVHRFGPLDERLVAYIVASAPEAPVDPSALAAFVGKRLTSYMVPSTIMVVPEVPLTPNGKLDRKRLPAPTAARAAEPMAPASDLEGELLEIWRKVLKTEVPSTNDDFFALGGHSILATQVINSINGHYHLDVPVRLLFENPTVRGLARALNDFEDAAWLDDSRANAAMLTRSNLRTLRTLDQLGEEQVDDFLRRHLEDPVVARFDDVEALLAWSRASSAPRDPEPGPDAARAPSPNDGRGDESWGSLYSRHYAELAQIGATLRAVDLRRHDPRATPTARDVADELAARLHELARGVFATYAHEVKQRLSTGGGDPTTPDGLATCCVQLMSVAGLAASLGPHDPIDRQPHDEG
jgi:amino acid adenylation domain-containing protein